MAINTTVYNSWEVQLGYAIETTFGTAIADDQNFTSLVEFDSISIDYGLFQDLSRKRRGSVPHLYDTDIYVSETGMTRVITISNLTLRKADAANILYALFQNVTEGAGEPYQKTFTFSGTAPEFANNAGMFMTLGLDKHIASHDEKFTSCILREATFKADLTAEDGRLKADLTFISGFATDSTANFSGTWSPSAQSYFNMHNAGNNQVDDTDIVLYNFEIAVNNNAVRGGNDTSGDCAYYALGDPEPTVDVSFLCKYDANVQSEIDAFLAGTETKIELGIGTGATDGDFALASYVAYTGKTREEHERGSALSLSGRGVFEAGGSAYPTISMADGTDKTW